MHLKYISTIRMGRRIRCIPRRPAVLQLPRGGRRWALLPGSNFPWDFCSGEGNCREGFRMRVRWEKGYAGLQASCVAATSIASDVYPLSLCPAKLKSSQHRAVSACTTRKGRALLRLADDPSRAQGTNRLPYDALTLCDDCAM